MTPFSLFYFLLATVIMIVALPFLILFSLKEKYKISIPKRFFLIKNPPFNQSAIWFHVCSFGEAISLKPLLERMQDDVNISVITATGFHAAKKYKATVRFLPFEALLPFWVKRQKVLVVSEAELWFMLFFMAKKRGAKTILMNARISDNSYKSYLKFAWFYKKIFSYVDVIFAQSEKDKSRLLEIGAREVIVAGNIKAYGRIEVSKTLKKPTGEVLTLASTHPGEEMLILDNIDYHDKKVIVVPRHPERFAEVGEFLRVKAENEGLRYHAYSQREDLDSDIVLIDKMGELVNIYAISDTVILGGSFVEGVGGHNPLEPATFGCKVLSGKYIFNQKALFDMVENIEVVDIEALPETIQRTEKTKINGTVNIEPIIKAINDVV